MDTMVEGVDFRPAWPGFDYRLLGRRLMAINLSDLAAMGALPRHALIALALPPSTPVASVTRLYQGIRDQARRFGFTIAGGDLSATQGPAVLTAALFGVVLPPQRPLTRSGGRAGWTLAVTGRLGEAALGLSLLERGERPETAMGRRGVRRLLDPTPRLEAAQTLLEAGVRVAGDISDGLPEEVRRICGPAGLGAEIELDALPVEPALKGEAAWLAVSASEDFELICAAPASTIEDCSRRLRQACGLSLTAVGRLTRKPGIRVLHVGRAIKIRGSGYEHFR